MKKIIPFFLIFGLSVCFTLGSCNKSIFLSAKPDQSLLTPNSLSDFQELMDNDLVINGSGNYGIVPAFGETGTDDYYCVESSYNTILTPMYKNAYVWAKDIYTNEKVYDWDFPYRAIFYCNVVLNGLTKIHITNDNEHTFNNIKGQALFNRAHMFYQLAQIFAPPYNKTDVSGLLGIPLRLKADVDEKIQRASLSQTYDQIISDLKESGYLLPVIPLYKTRPSKIAVYALLARVYQTIENYDTALLYADSCLSLDGNLMDYNTLDTTSYAPFTRFNTEVIFNCTLQSTDNTVPYLPYVGGLVDTTLYNSYNSDDLREALFFKDLGNGGYTFLGTYDGNYRPFGGLATDEVYLIRAECYARKGNISLAMEDLNTLLQNRYKTGTFIPLTAQTSKEALELILNERRKELCFRGLRWTDLRRLNQDPEFAITLERVIDGQTYTLPPNDPRYTYSIPTDIIGFNPDMPQNQR